MKSESRDQSACGLPSGNAVGNRAERVKLSEEEWKSVLNEEQFRILRDHGTERPFQNGLWSEKRPGLYVCAATGTPLFSSEDKYDSGTGWPSFTKPLSAEALGEEVDRSHGMKRVEVYCADCGGHLGHVFEDGPGEKGLRYCMNSTAMKFVPANSVDHLPGLIAEQKRSAEERIGELRSIAG